MTSASVSRGEDGAHVGQAALERQVVLDDAVDDDVDAVGRVEVRVGVVLVDAAVGGPAGVADAGRGGALGDGDAPVAVLLAADGARAGCSRLPTARTESICVAGDDRDARPSRSRGTRASCRPVEQELLHGALADVADDAAHGRVLSVVERRGAAIGGPGNGRLTVPTGGEPLALHDRDEPLADLVGLVLVGASTITRTSCSVPLGRTSTRPRPSSAARLALDRLGEGRRCAIAASRSATRTLTSRCGQLLHRAAVGEVAAAERLERQQRGGDAVARAARSPCR